MIADLSATAPACTPLSSAAMIDPELPAHAIEREVLHDGLRMRWQVGARTIAPFFVLWGATAFALRADAPPGALFGWLGATAAALLLRGAQARYMTRRLANASLARLRRFEQHLTYSGVLMNGALGAGFWALGLSSGDPRMHLLLTLISCVYSVSLLTYHAARFGGYVAGMLSNLGQAIAFWVLIEHHDKHLLIAAMLALLACTAARQAHLSSARFRRAVIDRMRRRALTARLERDKRAVEAALAIAREASESKASFLAAASHDLRQPIHALSLFVQTLAPTLEQADQRHLIGCIRRTTSTLEALFTNFLDLSRLDAGAVTVEARPFGLHALVDRLADEFGLLAKSRGLAFALRAPDAAWADSDALLLERVLRNLLSNALRNTTQGMIALEVEPVGRRLRIAVSDTGSGIAPADQERVFDEFVQVRDPTQPRPAGFGLGLAIVRRIDRLLGLELRLESAAGQGTRFELIVPAVDPPTSEAPAADRPAAAAAPV